jgi:hypothetical protein
VRTSDAEVAKNHVRKKEQVTICGWRKHFGSLEPAERQAPPPARTGKRATEAEERTTVTGAIFPVVTGAKK